MREKTSVDWPAVLRKFREAHGLKQRAAAADLRVSQATYSRWERGLSAPPVAVRNRLVMELLRARLPPTPQEWVSTFRMLPFPAAIVSEDGVISALSGVIRKGQDVQPEALEGLKVEDIVVGEALEARDLIREAGAFSGRVLCVEGCIRVCFKPGVKAGAPYNYHFVSWPHFTEDGRIEMVSYGVEAPDEEARRVRERLGGILSIHSI